MNYLINKKVNKNTRFLTSQLRNYLPGYTHSYNKFEKIVKIKFLRTAVSHAIKLDRGDSGWPTKLGTQVFKIAEQIIKLSAAKEE